MFSLTTDFVNSERLYRSNAGNPFSLRRVSGSLLAFSICILITGVASSETVAVYLRLYTIMFS